MASFKESEKDIVENIDTDVFTTEDLPTNDDDDYVRDFSDTKHDVKNFEGSDYDVTTTSQSHSEKHTSSSIGGRTSGKYHVKTADEEVEDALNAARAERSGDVVDRAADTAKATKDDVSYKAQEAADNVGDAKNRAGDKARETEDYVAGKARQTKDNVSYKAQETVDNVGDAKESVKGNLVDAKDTVKDTAGDIKGEADRAAGAHQPKVDRAKDEAGHKFGYTKNKAGEFGGAVQDTAGAAGNVIKEKAGQMKDTLGHAFGATKVKANEAGGAIQDKTADARYEASATAEEAKRRGEYHSKNAQDDANLAAGETKETAKGLLGGFQNILGEASKTIQDTVNAPGENITNE